MSKLMSGSSWLDKPSKEVTVKEAVESSLYGYSDGGQLETLSDKVSKQAEMIAALMQLLVDTNVLTLEQVATMLSYGYSVEE